MAEIDDDIDGFRDKCGVVGVYGIAQAAHRVYLALHALQHRGQDSSGIVSRYEGKLIRKVGLGLVSDVFNEQTLDHLKGTLAIGHVRYTTSGVTDLSDAQPIAAKTGNGHLAIAHNGNLVNAEFLRTILEQHGAIFHAQSDTEVICHLFANSTFTDLVPCLRDALERVKGAYSLCMIINDKLIGVRDPHGIRPLILGKLSHGYVLASEDCAFSLIDADYVREVLPGEMVVIDEHGVKSYDLVDRHIKTPAPCIFEHVYFSRPDSHIFGKSIYLSRKGLGQELAKEAPADADVVIAVPDSGVLAAMGYAERASIPYDIGLVRNHYVGRTFIEPQEKIRHFGVRLKLSPVREVVANKRLVVVDDSIVRGTTSKKIVSILRNAGAKEIHLRVSAPKTTHPCFYGIATPTKEELIASSNSTEAIREYLQVDSLAYLSIDGMYRALFGDEPKPMCDACFTGRYPI